MCNEIIQWLFIIFNSIDNGIEMKLERLLIVNESNEIREICNWSYKDRERCE